MSYKQKWFSIRSYVPIPFFLFAVIFSEPTFNSLLIGGILILLGELIRLWGVSVAGSETRTTDTVGGTHLFTNGPFGYVRNPLYLGNIIIYAGSMIAANVLMPWLAIFAALFFLLQYQIFISLEEEYLLKTFGDEFINYKKNVPKFIPRLTKYKGEHSFTREAEITRGLKSESRTLQIIFIFIIVLLIKFFQ